MPLPPRAVDARWTKADLRAQRRAAHLAARQQRTLLRAQRRALRRRSLLGPVLLVAFGVGLFALQSGHLQLVLLLAWLAHWWPLLLVLAGLVLLGEWALDHLFSSRPPSLSYRRRPGAGTVLLLGLLVFAGVAGRGLEQNAHWLKSGSATLFGETWNLDELFAQHTDVSHTLTAPLAKGALLTVQNFAGNITVTGASDDGQVHVTSHQRVWAWHSHDLREKQERSQPTLTADGAGLRLMASGDGRDRDDLTITVPHNAALLIAPEQGEVSVSEFRGPVTLVDHQGNVELTAITGPVTVTSQDDDADLTGHSLSGDIEVNGRAGDLSFSDITGSLRLHGDFFGTTRLERIQAPLHFQSSFTDLSCSALAGSLEIEGRTKLEADNLTGPVVISTTDRSLTLHSLHGGVVINNRNGPVDLSLADPLGPVSVTTTDASITVHVPPEAAFHLNGDTADGQITTDLRLPIQQHDRHTTVAGQVHSNGPAIELKTNGGDLKIFHSVAGLAKAEEKDEDD